MTEIKDKIKELRKEKNLTQAELGKKVGLSEITIRQYEKGSRKPRKDTIRTLASVLGCEVSALVDGIETPFWTPIENEPAPIGEALMVTVLRNCEGPRVVVVAPVYQLRTPNKRELSFYEYGDESREIGPDYFKVIAWARYPEPYKPKEET